MKTAIYCAAAACIGLACAPRDPFGGRPSSPPTADQSRAAACRENVRSLIGAFCLSPPSPLPPGYAESVRRGYESQRPACSPDLLEALGECVERLEALASVDDPGADARRQAARPKAEAMKKEPRFTKLLDDWIRALDQMKVVCRQQSVSDSHARECLHRQRELTDVEQRLRGVLVGAGFDGRDLGELGLWPRDPNPRE